MERLTMWYDGNQAVCENEDCSSDCCPFAELVCKRVQEIIDRLAAIEDILGDDYDLDRLRELVEADRDGRCVVLPSVKQKDRDSLFDALSEAVSSWGDMSDGEKKFSEAILAALKGEQHGKDL